MRSYLAAVLLLASVTASAGDLKDLDAKNGFRGLVFGQKLTSKDGFKMVVHDGDAREYTKPGDKLAVGRARLTFIRYTTWKTKFYGVALGFVGKKNCDELLTVFAVAYGHPSKPNKFIDTWYWMGDKVGVSLICSAFKPGNVLIMNRGLVADVTHEKQEQAKAGISDL